MAVHAIRDVDAELANNISLPPPPRLRTSTKAVLKQLQEPPVDQYGEVLSSLETTTHLSAKEVMVSVLEGVKTFNRERYGVWLADTERVVGIMDWVRPEVVALYELREAVPFEELVTIQTLIP
jgi:hypothetical protein